MADWAAAGDTRPEPPWLDDRGSGYRLGLLWEAWGGGWCVSCQAVGHGGLPVGYNNEPETQTAYRRPARSRSKRIIGGELAAGAEIFLNPWPSFGMAIFFALLGRAYSGPDGVG